METSLEREARPNVIICILCHVPRVVLERCTHVPKLLRPGEVEADGTSHVPFPMLPNYVRPGRRRMKCMCSGFSVRGGLAPVPTGRYVIGTTEH